jgi:predicted RNA-binding Zn-ribbon protein involved in translation (DUF1610 family)
MWLDEDQDKVHAWLRHRRELCPRCGTMEADWVDPATHRFHEEPKWEAATFRCPGCAEVERMSADVPTGERGVRIVLRPFELDDEEEEEVNGYAV